MSLPKTVIFDRDSTLCFASSVESSPLYYITELDRIILKPGVKEACRIISLHGIPIVLATKQRCISKGRVSRERVDLINARIERLLDIQFDGVLVEEKAENKEALYRQVLQGSLCTRSTRPSEIHLFDDSEEERTVAARMGLTVHDGIDLLGAVCKTFSIR